MFCTTCGHPFGPDDETCATCGAPRPVGPVEAPSARSPWAVPNRVGRSRTGLGGRRGWVAVALVVGGGVALLAVALLVIRALGGDSGGAEDPESAVRKLAVAVSAEDPVAALATMNPDEVRAMGQLYTGLEARAKALGYAPQAKALGGIDFALAGLTLEVEELGPDVARVRVSAGTLRYDVGRSGLGRSVNALIELEAANNDGPGEPVDRPDDVHSGTVKPEDLGYRRSGRGATLDPFIMVVKRHGGWFVSPLYTMAEYLAQLNGLPPGEFADVDAGKATADSPEEAVRNLADAAATADSDKAVDQLSGPELLVLRTYRRAIAEVVADRFDDAGVDRVEADVTEVDVTTTDLEDGLVKATITGVEGTAGWADEDGAQRATFSWDGRCLTVTRKGEDDSVDCLTADTRRFGVTAAYLVLEEGAGGWQVSPVATLLRYAEEVLPRLDENLLSRLFASVQLTEPVGAVEIGQPLSAELNDAGFAVYELAVKAGLRFTVVAGTGDGASVALVDEDLRPIPAAGVIDPDHDARWKLIVATPALQASTVPVTVTPVLERPLTVGRPVVGAIARPGQQVEYLFGAAAGDEVTVDVDNRDLRLALLDPAGKNVKPSRAGVHTLPKAGEYRVRVSRARSEPDADPAEYRLTVAEHIDFVLGNGSSDSATGAISTPTTFLTINLEVRGGSDAVVRAAAPNRAMDLTLVVITPDGTRTPTNRATAGGSESVRLAPATTTIYRLEVTAVGGLGEVRIDAERR